jgi:transposase-like protein
MLHHGISNTLSNKMGDVEVEGIHIRKNVYTKELIEFLVNKVSRKEMSISQVISTYGIPKTTFYKWLQKYSK